MQEEDTLTGRQQEATGGAGASLDLGVEEPLSLAGEADEAAGDDLLGGGLEAALGVLASDEPAGGEGPVRFDFSRPHGLPRSFEHRLRNLGENLAKATTLSFTGLFRSSTILEFHGVGLRPCGDWLRSLPVPTCLASLRLPPLKGQAALHLDLGLCFSLVKKLMGGAAEPEEAVREFTEIERSILRSLIERLGAMLKESAARLLPLEPEVLALENNPDYLGGIAPEDTLVQLQFKLKLEPVAGDLVLSLPLSGFEPVRHLLEPTADLEQRGEAEIRRDRGLVLDLVQGTESELIARLGELDISLQRLVRLQEGDLLHLPQRTDQPLVVTVDDRPLFLAEPGRLGPSRALKLVRRLETD